MTTNIGEEINTEADLSQLRPFLAKQHDNFVEMLQEPIDNAISSIVEDETYFDNPEPLTVEVTIKRHEDLFEIIVADHGSGISREDIRDHIFSTADTSASEGILNNMGAGLKASLCWCEVSLDETEGVSPLANPFRLYTKPGPDQPTYFVKGPVTANLEIRETTDEAIWERGAEELPTHNHGTRVHLTCSRSDFDDDVWPMATRLRKKLQFLREVLGVRFQRLLEYDEVDIIITYNDTEEDQSGQLAVEPLTPIYSDGFEHDSEEFTVEDEDGVQFDVTYEYGVLDTESIGEDVQGIDEGMYVSGNTGPLRWRYRQGNAGVDVYANGRILSIQEWPWESSSQSHNRFNRFHGQVTIIPQEPGEQVPTSNDKSDIDRTSRVWREIAETIREDHQPIETFQRGSTSETADDDETETSTDQDQDESSPEDDESETSSEDNQEASEGDSTSDSPDGSEEDSTDSREPTSGVDNGSETGSTGTGDDSTGSSPDTSSSSNSSTDTSTDSSRETSSTTSTDDDSGSADEDDDNAESADEPIPDNRDNLIEQIRTVLDEQEETVGVRQEQIAGADIDLIQETEANGTALWLVRADEATPDAVYELMMYQDHYKRSDMDDYTESVLIAPGLTDDAEFDFERAAARSDEHGHEYEFTFKDIDSVLE